MITNGFRFRVGMSLVLGLIWTSAAVGDGPLFPGAQYAAGNDPSSAVIGDLNGDQVPDLAVAVDGIVGEKVNRSLAPLPTTPITATE